MHPKELKIEDFTYDLPKDSIAQYPLPTRDESKLLLYKNDLIGHDVFANIDQHLPADSLLVFNNSKVVEARLLFQKESGGIIEIFALEPHEQYAGVHTAMTVNGHILYKCMVGGAAKWKHGATLSKQVHYNNKKITVNASLIERKADCFIIEIKWTPEEISFAEMLHLAGNTPIPPYLNRQADLSDKERYQTIYASRDGSVAAPTAGLHFTKSVLQRLNKKNILQGYTTLHVGAGTFLPVKTTTMQQHPMHAEYIEINLTLLTQLIDNKNIIAVGTTSMRTVESLYWMGLKALKNTEIILEDLQIKQWEVYDDFVGEHVDKKTALQALINWLQKQGKSSVFIKTQILIAPGYQFKIADGLITNFHQPQSTLLLLVSAFTGNNWQKIYEYALNNDFRFLSYGDSSLLFPKIK